GFVGEIGCNPDGKTFGMRRARGAVSMQAGQLALSLHDLCICSEDCVIAPSYGDTFAQNAVKNGLLTAVLPEQDVANLAAAIAEDPSQPVIVDLDQQAIS